MAEEILAKKECSRCHSVQPEGEFYFQTRPCVDGSIRRAGICRTCKKAYSKSYGWNSIHREEANSWARQWYHENKENARASARKTRSGNRSHYRLKAKQYQAADPERYRLYANSATAARRDAGFDRGLPEIRRAIAETRESYRIGDKYWDVYSSTLIDKPTIDHIQPLSKGGSNDLENMTVTSLANNSRKHNMPLIVWMARVAREAANKKAPV